MRYLIRVFSVIMLACLMIVMHFSAYAIENEESDTINNEQTTESAEAGTEEVAIHPFYQDKYKVVDIDLGEFQSEMTVGSSQMITPTAIYVDTKKYDEFLSLYTNGTNNDFLTTSNEEHKLFINWLFKPDHMIQPYYCDFKSSNLFFRSFSSKNTSIATVNAFGRIFAVSPGKTEIQIRCGNYIESVKLIVSSKASDSYDVPSGQSADYSGISNYGGMSDYSYSSSSSKEAKIAVKDIDFGEYDKKIEVGKSFALSVSIIPSNATDAELSFSSSDNNIATVNGLGRVTGISPGLVVISAMAGGIKRSISLDVEVKTEGIEIDNSYVILKPEEEHAIVANVVPANAPQKLTYKSLDENIAIVSDEGNVKAISPGSSSVVVSNGSVKSVVSIIVNQQQDDSQKIIENEPKDETVQEQNSLLDEITIGQEDQEYYVSGTMLPIITTDYLSALYGTNKTLTVKQDGYSISVCGKDIVNIENELITTLNFISMDDVIQFSPNNSNRLPGKIKIITENLDSSYKWLYLFNESLGKWQRLSSFDNGVIIIDSEGQYCLRQHKELLLPINWWIVFACCVVIIVGIGIYIATGKKYWFW